MTEKLNPQITSPDLGILDEKCLDLSRVTCFVNSEILPLFCFHRITIADTDAKCPYHTREELVVGQNESIDPNIFLFDISRAFGFERRGAYR